MTTPTVYEQVPIGTIMLSKYNMNLTDPNNISSFYIIGDHYVFYMIGDNRFSCDARKDFDFDEHMEIVSNPAVIQYLRDKARRFIGSIITECEEGILDD